MNHLEKFYSEALGRDVFHKLIKGRSLKHRKKMVEYGIAFRTKSAPIGYLPFFAKHDYNCDGTVSFMEEWIYSHVSLGVSGAGSPHTLLLKYARNDIQFCAGDPGGDHLNEIVDAVKQDATAKAVNIGTDVFLNGVMSTFGGKVAGGLAKTLVKSKVKQFIISNAIEAAVSSELKKQAGLKN